MYTHCLNVYLKSCKPPLFYYINTCSISMLFEIIVEFPDSKPALFDLKVSNSVTLLLYVNGISYFAIVLSFHGD